MFLLPTKTLLPYAANVELKASTVIQGQADPASDQEPSIAWFCVRSQPRHEHIATRHLRQMENVEVFNPRIRFSRATRYGPVCVTESLFPNYLFVRFDWKTSLPRVHYAPGVSGVVHFGIRWPQVPDQVIAELRRTLGPEDVQVVPKEFQPGEEVQVAGGIMHGLAAVITQVMPGKERVMVLMDFLGRQSSVELPIHSIVKRISR